MQVELTKALTDKRIQGIKAIRAVSGYGLQDAKDASDKVMGGPLWVPHPDGGHYAPTQAIQPAIIEVAETVFSEAAGQRKPLTKAEKIKLINELINEQLSGFFEYRIIGANDDISDKIE